MNIKNDLNVGVIVNEPYIYYDKIKKRYAGVIYDNWLVIKQNLEKKYNVHEKIIKDNDFDKFIEDMKNNKYDIGVGPFTESENRFDKVLFTTPILIERNSLLHKTETTLVGLLARVFETHIIPIFIIIILIGIFLGSLLNRMISSHKNLLKDKKSFAILSVGSLLGAHGPILSRALEFTSRMPVIFVFGILFISMFTSHIIQAIITSKLVTGSTNINVRNIIKNNQHKKIIVPKHYILTEKANQIYNSAIKTVVMDHKNYDDVIQYYLKQTDKFHGISLPSLVCQEYAKKYNLVHDNTFGNEQLNFVVNLNKPTVLMDLNEQIVRIRDRFILRDNCKTYLDESNLQICTF
jgi:hypothetical protein